MKKWKRVKAEKDPYRELARKLGLRSRAYFKLKDIDRRYRILKAGYTVLDLGAYPGGWLQYSSEKVGLDGEVIGIDIREIEEFIDKPNIYTIKGDIFSDKTIKALSEHLDGKQVDTILSDLSPNITGIWELDIERIYEYNLRTLDYVNNFLKRGGNLVLKSFSGRYTNKLRKKLEKIFRYVYIYKPKASRKRSAEEYFICKGYRPPRRERNSLREQSLLTP